MKFFRLMCLLLWPLLGHAQPEIATTPASRMFLRTMDMSLIGMTWTNQAGITNVDLLLSNMWYRTPVSIIKIRTPFALTGGVTIDAMTNSVIMGTNYLDPFTMSNRQLHAHYEICTTNGVNFTMINSAVLGGLTLFTTSITPANNYFNRDIIINFNPSNNTIFASRQAFTPNNSGDVLFTNFSSWSTPQQFQVLITPNNDCFLKSFVIIAE